MTRRDVVVVRDGPVTDYVLNAIIALNAGADEVEIVGRGQNIAKAVSVFNVLRSRLEGTLKVLSVEIGSEVRGRDRRVPYIKIRVTQSL